MTAILCTALVLAAPPPCVRGGHAATIPPPRGGHALVVLRVRDLPTFDAFVCIHEHEGRWNDTGDPYWGGLQFDRNFMRAYGRDMLQRHHGRLADAWTPAEQITVAHRAWLKRGFAPWPMTRRMCGV